ncbi:putative GNAT family acetyltransferase [Aspergillus heteromorphus CBS 117.55]|uniref:Putative GNAT family acetyltransferase n=1 Tax=Aspergillus heteromorphus CBS 117.55 TaxID=1448321 RepID=A0A317X2Q2_9EURO|nr:putative GNAT family acetyltransferase [Aspergillus heteromorphus CBS 117.55]PWY92833.1 putative GNAT family acetyltransferase [Aspergillus heteromorphus CBS 117.55]
METPRIELVRLTKEHALGYFSVWSDPHTTRWSCNGPCKTLQDAEDWMASLLPDENPTGENYAILIRRDLDQATIDSFKPETEIDDTDSVFKPGGFIGWIGTWRSEPLSEVGFVLHRSTWGLGFATEAMKAFTSLFWRLKPNVEYLAAFSDTENVASIRVLTKCGFRWVGVEFGEYELEWMVPQKRDTSQYRLYRGVNDGINSSRR